MIDPRTPILVGCGQITDTQGAPTSERSRVDFCAEAAALALDDTHASIGGHALGHHVDARLLGEQPGVTCTHHGVIIDQQNFDHADPSGK